VVKGSKDSGQKAAQTYEEEGKFHSLIQSTTASDFTGNSTDRKEGAYRGEKKTPHRNIKWGGFCWARGPALDRSQAVNLRPRASGTSTHTESATTDLTCGRGGNGNTQLREDHSASNKVAQFS